MNTPPPRVYMRATCPFPVGEEDIEEGDLLALTHAEAIEMLQRGLVAPADTAPAPATSHTITDEALAAMRERMLGWSAATVFSDTFRHACANTADLIAAHLDGVDNAAETAQAVERTLGELAAAEHARITRVEDLDGRMVEAYERDDVAAWLAAFRESLDHLSEGHAESLMHYVGLMGQSDDGLDTAIDMALLHEMPGGIQ